MRWQALQEDAGRLPEGMVQVGVPTEESTPDTAVADPVGLFQGPEGDPETRRQFEEALGDGYELKTTARRGDRVHHERVSQDIEADREDLAGRHLRLAHRPDPGQTAPQNLLGTLASQRKATVRSRRRVDGKRGTQTKRFDGALHPGMWRAQPMGEAKAKIGVGQTPRRPGPSRRQAIAIT